MFSDKLRTIVQCLFNKLAKFAFRILKLPSINFHNVQSLDKTSQTRLYDVLCFLSNCIINTLINRAGRRLSPPEEDKRWFKTLPSLPN